MRRRFLGALGASLLAVLLVGAGSQAADAAVWSSTAAFGSWSQNGYTLNNDVWGSGAGPQTIWANSYSNWGVWSNQPNTGGVKSYPHDGRTVGIAVNSLHSATSSFNVSVPGSGAYNTAYDIWLGGYAYEVMLWMNKTGAVGPLGTLQTTATVGGHTWQVYKGSNGSNQVFSFVRTGNTSAGSVDVRSVLTWINGRGWYSNPTLNEIQFGWEITSSSGGLNFQSNSFSISYS
jgi:hypothetical protein